ncbi:restriction endonuclease subunit S [Anaerococcus kampingiae]|uniref:Restriction endonuclease subunit S n=1 Tax=Anaerococcus kampingae TaxID=3115614 RepID=A0ABW9MEX2_9FIRM
MEYRKISDISTLRNENIKSNKNKNLLYITTTHLLPEKEGVSQEFESSLGKSGKLFYKDDILVSNIRPYFKKIWKAEKDGITSNDVLIFLSNDVVHQDYLYYLLSQDSFFNMMTLTSKGTKMPRGDKKAIALYEVPILDKKQQKSICDILINYDKKIETNNKIIANLEAQAQALFKYYFVDFEPFVDGNFVDSDLGIIPEGWEISTIGKISKVRSGKRPNGKTSHPIIPIVGANGLTGYCEDYLYDEKVIITGRVGTLGIVKKYYKKIWPSDNTLVFTSSNYFEYLYFQLLEVNYSSLNRGSTQPLISQKDIKNIKIVLPNEIIINRFQKIIKNIFELQDFLTNQNQTLAETRDALLPKLMAGEIDLENLGGPYD